MPTLTGNLYLLENFHTFTTMAQGTVTVKLYDVSNGEPIQLERWTFDSDTLSRLLVKDALGWGYRLILPWSSYRADITGVELRVQVTQPSKDPLYATPFRLYLKQPNQPQRLPDAGVWQTASPSMWLLQKVFSHDTALQPIKEGAEK
jgi:hypothetical protein